MQFLCSFRRAFFTMPKKFLHHLAWLNITNEDETTTVREAYRHVENYQDTLDSYDRPCLELFFSSVYNWDTANTNLEFAIKFFYTQQHYEQIQYSKSFGGESFISNVGGFIGIFLGYSMMQLPELLAEYFLSYRRFRREFLNGKT